jgi:hypothetical protein
VRIVRLRDRWLLSSGGDIADVLAIEGGDVDAVRRGLDELIADAEPVERDDVAPAALPRPTFDLDLLIPDSCAWLGEWFRALATSTQVAEELVALPGLAIANAAVCNVASVKGPGDWKEHSPLWALALASPGERKSAVFSALTAPVSEWESAMSKALAPEIERARHARDIEEARLADLKKRAAKQPDAGARREMAEEITAIATWLADNPVPTVPELLVSEPTPEALAGQMQRNHGRALLADAEGGALDIVRGLYSGGTSNYSVLLKSHAGDRHKATRVGRVGDFVERPALALALVVQPAAVAALFADDEAEGRGLLARFAVVAPPSMIGKREARPAGVPRHLRAKWRSALFALLDVRVPDEPVEVGLDRDADRVLLQLQRDIEADLGDGDLADRTGFGSKLAGAGLRIALTLHALSTWAEGGKPQDAPPISAETMRCAVAWTDYLRAAERHARSVIGGTGEDRDRSRLVEWIERKGGTVTVRDLRNGPAPWRGDTARSRDALAELAEAGFGSFGWTTPAESGGRPTERFVLSDGAP